MSDRPTRGRRPPPPFRRLELVGTESLSPFMTRLTFAGDGLADLLPEGPAASVRLLIPGPATEQLVLPSWRGNEFLFDDGSRPIIRTFTPLITTSPLQMSLDVVLHEEGAVSSWAQKAQEGDEAAASGPGRAYRIDVDADHYLLMGDETAIPAIFQLLEAIPEHATTAAIVEIRDPEARLELPQRLKHTGTWVVANVGASPGTSLEAAVRAADLPAGSKVWAAGEAASMFRLRKHLFEERDVARADATVRGYWKLR